MTKYLTFICVLIVLFGCKREGKLCLSKAGHETTIEMPLESFSHLECYDNIDIVIIQDTVNKAVLNGYEEVLSTVTLEQNSSNLKIQKAAKCDWYRDYNKNKVSIGLHCTSLNKIGFFDAGEISSLDTLFFEYLDIEGWDVSGAVKLTLVSDTLNIFMHTGPAIVKIKGTSTQLYAYSAGSGEIDLSELQGENVVLNNSGIADIKSWCTSNLGYELRSFGNIIITGNPTINYANDTGEGQFIQN
jgi:hypothetical protein